MVGGLVAPGGGLVVGVRGEATGGGNRVVALGVGLGAAVTAGAGAAVVALSLKVGSANSTADILDNWNTNGALALLLGAPAQTQYCFRRQMQNGGTRSCLLQLGSVC